MSDTQETKTLIATNQSGLYDTYRTQMECSGRWAVLFSDENEFIAGDGFFHNFPASQDSMNSGRKLVLPILPTAAIVYMLPMRYPSEPRLVTLRICAAEVEALNEIVQVYSSDFLFFRDEKPTPTDAFKLGRHRVFKHQGHDWLDGLLDDLSQYSGWGENGAAGMSGDRPFSEALKGNRWLEGFRTRDD